MPRTSSYIENRRELQRLWTLGNAPSDVIPCQLSLSYSTPAPAGAQIALHHHNTRDSVIVNLLRDDKLVSKPALGSLQSPVIYLINPTSLAKDNGRAQCKTDLEQYHVD